MNIIPLPLSNPTMNLIEILKIADGRSFRRPGWQDGICAYVKDPKAYPERPGRYAKESRKSTYLATCHVAACELPGVRLISDLLADDWEFCQP